MNKQSLLGVKLVLIAALAGSQGYLPAVPGLVPTNLVRAQSATASPSTELRQIIRERIEQTLEDKKQTKPTWIGTIGTVQRVASETFVITDVLGRERTIDLDTPVAILVNGKTGSLADLTIGSGAVVMGTPIDEVVVRARRILIQERDFSENRTAILATLTKLDRTSLQAKVRGSGEDVTLTTTSQTRYEDILGNLITRSILSEDESILLITDVDSKGTRYVKRVRRLVPIEGATATPVTAPPTKPATPTGPATPPTSTAGAQRRR